MWVAKLLLKHDCIIGKRCSKFNCTSVGYPLDFFEEHGFNYFFHFEKLSGESKNIDNFIKDLKKDKRIYNLEAENNILFFTYKTKSKGEMPTQSYLKKVFHLKPVFVDIHGVEHWEVGSWKKESLIEFIEQIKKQTEGLEMFKLQKIVKTKLRDVYFPHIMPLMTPLQEKALRLAQKEGYYEFPRKIELRMLAKMFGVSLSTYREHLRKAEKVVLKNF
ncbi:helix-turn-helix domain-containing protein [Candidatus Woesearchaeota archaeon]|nr:helix-turn-helix domain-containing protein [Candidatus Woesearchaeota archaeon]